ncbi:hypothetical protein [Thermococcus sp.]|uniref:hypothetical protein n=1 Tax=Thermococcus sp. TaxID=35749 RepID=UPI002619D7BB|nr:hypothetical protein [Thermococcus sp.]
MRFHRVAIVVSAIMLIAATFLSSYAFRWLAVLFLGTFLAFLLFGFEMRVAIPELRRRIEIERKTDVERTVGLIRKARSGRVARSLVEEKIVEIYATLSDDYNSTYRSLLSEPNEALKVLRSEGDFLDNLERALKIVEADLNED